MTLYFGIFLSTVLARADFLENEFERELGKSLFGFFGINLFILLIHLKGRFQMIDQVQLKYFQT